MAIPGRPHAMPGPSGPAWKPPAPIHPRARCWMSCSTSIRPTTDDPLQPQGPRGPSRPGGPPFATFGRPRAIGKSGQHNRRDACPGPGQTGPASPARNKPTGRIPNPPNGLRWIKPSHPGKLATGECLARWSWQDRARPVRRTVSGRALEPDVGLPLAPATTRKNEPNLDIPGPFKGLHETTPHPIPLYRGMRDSRPGIPTGPGGGATKPGGSSTRPADLGIVREKCPSISLAVGWPSC